MFHHRALTMITVPFLCLLLPLQNLTPILKNRPKPECESQTAAPTEQTQQAGNVLARVHLAGDPEENTLEKEVLKFSR